MSVQRCKAETTSTEFVKWQDYLRQDMNIPSRADYYLAQLTAAVVHGTAKNPNEVHIKQFLIDFTPEAPRDVEATEDQIEQHKINSKAVWAARMAAAKTVVRQPPPQPTPEVPDALSARA